MTIETPRLRLREWTDADLEPWVRMGADPRVMEFFPQTYTREHALQVAGMIRERLQCDGYGSWVVDVTGDLPFAGIITLQEVPFQAHFTPAYEVGWRLVPEAWGHGFATEGARAAIDFAFDTLGWHEVVAMTATINRRSRRVMGRLGMTYDPKDDFDHPRIEPGHRLNRHVLYRICRQ